MTPIDAQRNLVQMSGKEKHKHKQICGIVPGLGGCQNFVYVFFFFGSFLMGEKKHINKMPHKIPGQSRDNFVYVFFLYEFFSLPKMLLRSPPLKKAMARQACALLSRWRRLMPLRRRLVAPSATSVAVLAGKVQGSQKMSGPILPLSGYSATPLSQQFTYGVVSEGLFCGKFAEFCGNFPENCKRIRFIASGKGAESLQKVCGYCVEICGKFSAMTPSRTTP